MPWIELEKIREVGETGILGDILSHLPSNHHYGSSVHEGTHGINSIIRNKVGYDSNGAYLLNNQAFHHKEPQGLRLRDVAKAVPEELKGSGFQLYLVKQRRYWDDHPLYVIDELSAYHNGTYRYLDQQDRSNTLHSCRLTIEFLGYLAIIVQEVREDELRAFLNEMYDRVLNLISSVNKEYDTIELSQQMEVVSKYFDDPLDYVMI